MLHNLAKAYRAENNSTQRKELLTISLAEIKAAWKQLQIANHPPFFDWYEHDRLFGMRNIQRRLQEMCNSQE